MDIDEVLSEQPKDLLSLFDITPEQFPWRDSRPEEIQSRRSLMSKELFFDILLEVGGITNPETVYPPTDVVSLRHLLDVLAGATYDSMKRDCLVFYLLKWHGDGREMKYADDKCISPHYVAIADAYWHLDTGVNLRRAISLLSDARIVKDYSSKIIETLMLSKESNLLLLKYVRTCKPALTERQDIKAYFLAIAESNMMEAWQYQRTFQEKSDTRDQLIRDLLEWSVTPTPRVNPITQLLSLPFSSYEESVVQNYAVTPPSHISAPSIANLRDLVCVRMIQSCKYTEAVKFDRRFPTRSSTSKGTWSAQRRRMVAEILAALPASERVMLEQEVERQEPIQSKLPSLGSAGSWSSISGGSDLGMSWEHVGPKAKDSNVRIAPRPSNGVASPATPSIFDRSKTRPGRQSIAQVVSSSSSNLAMSQSIFTPGASTSSANRQPPPLSAQSTLLSQSTSQPLSFSSQLSFSPSAFTLSSSTNNLHTSQLPQLAASSSTATVNGTPKSNAFMTRNAFYEPPTVERPAVNGFHIAPEETEVQTDRRSPELQPAQKEEERPVNGDDSAVERQPSMQKSMEMDGGPGESDREDLGYSLFGTAEPTQPKPKRTSKKPSGRTRGRSQQQMPPGAFVPDSDEEQPTAPVAKAAPVRPPPPAQTHDAGKKRNTRKRAASPDQSPKLSIPGALFSEEEDDEDDDDIGPLPPKPMRGSRKGGRSSKTSSRASSVHEDDVETGRTVRRSSRLSTASSPTEAKASSRPRKSTRTTGAGATATGRSTKKR
ncbi:hypothetical protein BD410DRAFT_769761 [Rickenella mellea]|uniref:ELYS-like domain-containing protein n=1 Tax=Rickenella mellea TaxID=50990 RepID=A0A4Y7Q5V1_9AGAM|nr:hypothetical protein BD410DRAFT_769761 [Rickenella mellea]